MLSSVFSCLCVDVVCWELILNLFRLMMLSSVGPSTERNWSEDSYPGVRNLQIKLWKLVYQVKVAIFNIRMKIYYRY